MQSEVYSRLSYGVAIVAKKLEYLERATLSFVLQLGPLLVEEFATSHLFQKRLMYSILLQAVNGSRHAAIRLINADATADDAAMQGLSPG